MKRSKDTPLVFTYGLIDPRTFELKYIGITKNIKTRLLDHIRIAKNDLDTNIHKRSWIKHLLNLNLKPEIIILETCLPDDSANSEIWWISLCRSLGFNLTNLTDGGDYPNGYWEGRKHTEETKQKQSQAIGGYYKTHNHPFKGGKLSSKHSENIVKAWKEKGIYGKGWNYFVPEERVKEVYQRRSDNETWRKNLSESLKKKYSDPTKNVMYGKKHLPESKEKNRISNLMYTAYRKGDYLLIAELQEDYFEIVGHYQPDYAEFAYVPV